jgi:hypothetical protein
MTNTALPPLPRAFVPGDEFNPRDFYTADQMHAYAQEAVRASLASKPDARMHAREAAQHVEALCHRVMSGYEEARQHERIAMTIHRESDPQEWLKQQRHATACRTDAQLALRELRAAAIDALSAHGVKQPEPADALDAKRLDWLESEHAGLEPGLERGEWTFVRYRRYGAPIRHEVQATPRLAIDAAMSSMAAPIHEARPDDRKEQT